MKNLLKKNYEVRSRDLESNDRIVEIEELPKYFTRRGAERYRTALEKIRVDKGYTSWYFYVHDLRDDV